MLNSKNKELMNKGFTLIELLGVLIILAVIALITFPIIDNAIKNSREKSLERTIDAIEEAAYRYSIENDIGYPTEKQALYLSEIQSKGFLESSIINPVTEEELSGCVWYYWESNYNQYIFEYDSECVKVDTEPTINIIYNESLINSNGWAKENITVTLSGNGEIKYCLADSECEPNEIVETGNNTKFITSEGTNYICALTTNSLGSSDTLCQSFKLDKTLPNIKGVPDLKVNKNEVVNLSDGVTYNDALSGIDGKLTIEPSSVNTSSVGIKEVKYSIKDKAGNVREITRRITVEMLAPTITYNLVDESSINSNGWAKENFYVKATIADNGGGIKSAKSCVSNTSSECEPIAEISGTTKDFYIEVEGNNRLCIEVIDNQENTVLVCSDTYKLDKTAPTVGSININGTKGSNDWYTSNVSISVNNGSDSLSGHDSTKTNVNSITSNTAGTTVTVTTKDLAGNTATQDYTIKVDKDSPVITAKSGTVEITEGDSNPVSNYFNYSYSTSGGSISCTPTNTSGLSVGNQTVSCTVTGKNGKSTSASRNINVKILYKDGSGANKPELLNNMIPIKYNGTNWVYADISEEWYNYNSKEWANAVVLNNGVSKSVGQTISESEIALWYVWIPRYKYKLFNANNGSVDRQLINVTFEPGTASTGIVRCTDAVSGSGNSSETCTNATNGNWYTHPAFTFGGEQLTGFWVGKFEVSTSDSTCNSNSNTTNCDKVSTVIIKPGISSWRYATVSNFYTSIQNISTNYNLNGDSHMMKNMEWGAVAYLKQSTYGLGIEDIIYNSNINYYTGGGSSTSYKSNIGQSTTRNIYGVYDMSGGASEYVMGNMVKASREFYSSYAGFSSAPDAKYYDKYTYSTSTTTHGRGKLGDATKETLSSFGSTSGGWYSDFAYFPYSGNSWFTRGRYYSYHSFGSADGVFNFDRDNGRALSSISARAVVCIRE